MHDHDGRMQRGFFFFFLFFFARAIRQLSSRCTFVREFLRRSGSAITPTDNLSWMCECTALQQLRGAPDTPSWNDLYHFMNHISTVSFSTARLFFLPSHESVRQDVECRRWSGGFPSEWGGRGGLDSKSGLQWEGRGHVPVCSHCGDGSSSGGGGVGGGWSRVLRGHSLLSSHSQLLPGGWVGGRGYEIPWCTLLRHAGLGAEWGDNEVDPVEYCWEKHCATLAARRGRMNELHVDRSAKKLPPDTQKGSDKTQQSECNRLCSSHQSWVFSFSHSFLISEMIKKRRGFKFV